MFIKLVRDPQAYQGIRIGRDYRVDASGSVGQDMKTSEGGKQLVALSLIGALKQAAVRGGPVVLDSPLARLDLEHRANVLQTWVPELGSQAILLVQSGELTEDHARDILGSRIGQETGSTVRTMIPKRRRSRGRNNRGKDAGRQATGRLDPGGQRSDRSSRPEGREGLFASQTDRVPVSPSLMLLLRGSTPRTLHLVVTAPSSTRSAHWRAEAASATSSTSSASATQIGSSPRAEKLAELGVREIARRLEGNKSLADIMSEVSA